MFTFALKLMGFSLLAVSGIPGLARFTEFLLRTLPRDGELGSADFWLTLVLSGGNAPFLVVAGILLIKYSCPLGRFLCPAEHEDKNTVPETDWYGVALSVLGVYVITLAAMSLAQTGAEALGLRHSTIGREALELAWRLRIQVLFGGIQLGLGVGLFLQSRGAASVWRLIQERRRFS
jgi:uncharacterized membrane-anchored protein YitT (DUF2179 family)